MQDIGFLKDPVLWLEVLSRVATPLGTICAALIAALGVSRAIKAQRHAAAVQAVANSLAKFRQEWINSVRGIVRDVLRETDKMVLVFEDRADNARAMREHITEAGKVLEELKIEWDQEKADLVKEETHSLRERHGIFTDKLNEALGTVRSQRRQLYLFLGAEWEDPHSTEDEWIKKLDAVIDCFTLVSESRVDKDKYTKAIEGFSRYSRERLDAKWQLLNNALELAQLRDPTKNRK